MKKIYQNTDINCVEACVASLMEDETILNTFPILLNNAMWLAPLRMHIRKTHGLIVLTTGEGEDIPGYVLAGGPTVRTPYNGRHHAVIYKEGELVHDPKVGGLGLVEVTDYMIFTDSFRYYTENRSLLCTFENRFL